MPKLFFRLLFSIYLTGSVVHIADVLASNFTVEQEFYGELEDNQVITKYIFNGPQITFSAINYGGIITSLEVPDKNGQLSDVVLGYDKLNDYVHRNRYFGAIIGRFANRLEGSKATINGRTFELEKNRSPHHLHGGSIGFDKVVWRAKTEVTGDGASLILSYLSKDGEAGYPGNLYVTVTYTANIKNQLIVEYQASSDAPTIFNPTQHSYFNLSGNHAAKIDDHILMLNSKTYLPLTKESIPMGALASTEGTPFDFSSPTKLAEVFEKAPQELRDTKGLDHFWVSKESRGSLSKFAELSHPKSGRKLTVLSTEVGGQIYSGNYLNYSVIGKRNTPYQKRSGICIETGQYPNSPNNGLPSVVINLGEEFYSKTVYAFSIEK
ncbi:aldose epimerase family protein [Aliiglaciecola sp. NS0011-25]|uniref:aldose epimerase family protein n=1 Tax=Aliiglaciecola sp. NS0011-25 TaxID=3127654 RepID=UPI003102958A